MDEKAALKPDEIQLALAEKRVSIRESLYSMEQETEQRLRQTLDEVHDKILATSDDISRIVTKPFHKVQEQLAKVPESLRTQPAKTLFIAASVGAAVGFAMGRRGRHRRLLTRALLANEEPRVIHKTTWSAETKRAVNRGFLAGIAVEVAHQILLSSIFSLMRRRN